MLAALLATSFVAHATAASPFVTRLMGREPGPRKTFACFARDYDEAHRATHPAQNMQSVWVLAVAYASLDNAVQLRMSFRFEGRPETLTSVAECGRVHQSGDSTLCAGPIGGGHMSLSLQGDHRILMNIPRGAHLWKPGPPSPSDTVDDAFGSDDRLFRLERTSLSRCLDQAFPDEKALLERDRN
jgi:hypothetical protein